MFVYAVAFTFAYITLGAATGALILFPTVQLTLVLIATLRGSPPSGRQQIGMAIAVMGLVILLGPRSSAPPLVGAILMGIAGIAWGVYTLLGRGAMILFARTARNFWHRAVRTHFTVGGGVAETHAASCLACRGVRCRHLGIGVCSVVRSITAT